MKSCAWHANIVLVKDFLKINNVLSKVSPRSRKTQFYGQIWTQVQCTINIIHRTDCCSSVFGTQTNCYIIWNYIVIFSTWIRSVSKLESFGSWNTNRHTNTSIKWEMHACGDGNFLLWYFHFPADGKVSWQNYPQVCNEFNKHFVFVWLRRQLTLQIRQGTLRYSYLFLDHL